MKTRFNLIAGVLLLTVFSCSKKEEEAALATTITSEEIGINSKIDVTIEDITKIVDDNLTVQDGVSGRSMEVLEVQNPNCVSVTRVPALGTVPPVNSTVVKTIDFGTEGCQIPNGNILKGKIVISYLYNPGATNHTVTTTFDNFYNNNRKIEGTKTMIRTIVPATNTIPAHPKFESTFTISVTFEDGRKITRTGTRSSEIIEGYATPLVLSDNVYSVTGNWTTTFPNSNVLTSTITSPLIVKLSCIPTNSALSKGIISLTRDTTTATLDYGNGTCDKLATLTVNGVTFPIVLN